MCSPQTALNVICVQLLRHKHVPIESADKRSLKKELLCLTSLNKDDIAILILQWLYIELARWIIIPVSHIIFGKKKEYDLIMIKCN